MLNVILFTFFFIIVISIIFIFIFDILDPALKQQNILLDKAIFADSEISVRNSLVPDLISDTNKIAVVRCSCEKDFSSARFKYSGPKNCSLFNANFDSEIDCKWSCIGFGDCVKSCEYHAISIVNQTAVISSMCNGCGKCVEVCPRGIIRLVPVRTSRYILCGASSGAKTKCNMYLKESDLETSGGIFKFWKKFYKIFK